MFILDYFKRFKQTVTKVTFQDEVGQARDILNNSTIPSLKRIQDRFGDGSEYKSRTYNLYKDAFATAVTPVVARQGMVNVLLKACDNVDPVLTMIDKRVSKEFGTEISRGSLTASNINVIHLLDAVNLFMEYSREMMMVILHAEINFDIDKQANELRDLVPAQTQYLGKYREGFLKSVEVLLRPLSDIEKALDRVPDINLGDVRSPAMTAMAGNDKLDPLGFGQNFTNSPFNIIWLLAVGIPEAQDNRYRKAMQDEQVISLKCDRLRRQIDKNSDPRLIRQLEANERDLITIRKKTERYLEKAGAYD